MDRPRRLIFAGAVLATGVAAGALPGAAQTASPREGAWRLQLDGSHRSCVVTLSSDAGAERRVMRFPAGCRRALPILNGVGGWADDGNRLRFLDPEGQSVLEFAERDPEGASIARTAGGEVYRISSAEAPLRSLVRPVALPPPPIGVPQATPVDPAKAPAPATVPGTYVVDRYTEREVCRIGLASILVASHGRHEARLLEGCRDAGLLAFDPVAWRYEAGRLTLTARRGHEVTLISERPNHWRRDPEVGATLVLRRASP
jgi:hypothetical protein